jgi:hypothetical protein
LAALERLEGSVQEHAQQWVAALNDLLQRQSAALVGAANAMVQHHNTAMDGLKARFVTQAPQELDDALAAAEDALSHLGEEAAERAAALGTEAGRLQEWIGHALPGLAPVQAALESAAGLE